MVIPLLRDKTRCADKSTAEHYEHTYIHMGYEIEPALVHLSQLWDFGKHHEEMEKSK